MNIVEVMANMSARDMEMMERGPGGIPDPNDGDESGPSAPGESGAPGE